MTENQGRIYYIIMDLAVISDNIYSVVTAVGRSMHINSVASVPGFPSCVCCNCEGGVIHPRTIKMSTNYNGEG